MQLADCSVSQVTPDLLDATGITFDIDWAPDFVIDEVAERLLQARVKATWMVTHKSAAIERLAAHQDLFELGLHPNFLPGSTHGSNPQEVLQTCLELVPDARCVRTHALVQSSPLFWEVCSRTRLEVDLSLFLPGAPYITPIVCQFGPHSLVRLPYFWEDDTELYLQQPPRSLPQILDGARGLKIFNFHPIHVYLNSENLRAYERLKEEAAVFHAVEVDEAAVHRSTGHGVGSVLEQLLDHISERSYTVSELLDLWRSREGAR